MPADLLDALAHAVTVLGWYENLTEDEIPPEWMWHLADELEGHFARVRSRRGSPGPSTDDDDDESDGYMMKNAYARERGPYAR